MSRTIGSVLTFAGTAALVASGVGALAGSALFVGAGGFSIAGVSTGALLAASTALTAAGTAISAAAGSKAPAAETSKVAIKTERPPRAAGYGRFKTYGSYILYETAPDGVAVDAWAFHDGRIDGIEQWYLGDAKVTRQESGFVLEGPDGAYGNSDTIQIGANLGMAVETAHAPLIAKLPEIWTEDHRGDGVVTGYMISNPVKTKDYQQVYPVGGPNQMPLGIVIRAQLVFDWRDPAQDVGDPRTWKWSENAWLHIGHYKLVREAVGPTRPPSDPLYWTDIAALYEARWARLFAPTLAYWTDAADDADSPVPLKGGGTEPRYRSCVSHRLAGEGSEPKAVLGALLACCDGWMVPRADGAIVVHSGRYYAPTVTIGPDLILSYTVEDGTEDENAINHLNVTYISSEHDFNEVDCDPWVDEDDIATRGRVRADDLKNQVPSNGQGRRLAKRKAAQIMAPKRGTVAVRGEGDAMLTQRFVNLRLVEAEGTDDEFAPYIGPAEITDIRSNPQTGGLTASWIAADPNIDAWNAATEEGEPAPVGERVAREPLAQPDIISATAVYSTVGQNPEGEDELGDPVEGTVSTGARVLIAADGPMRADLTWYARWRVGTSGSWNEREYADADPGPAVSFTTEFVPLVTNLNVEVAYTAGDGRLSPWSEPTVVDTAAA